MQNCSPFTTLFTKFLPPVPIHSLPPVAQIASTGDDRSRFRNELHQRTPRIFEFYSTSDSYRLKRAFTLCIHYGGKFKHLQSDSFYEGGKVRKWDYVQIHNLSIELINGYYDELRVHETRKFYVGIPHVPQHISTNKSLKNACKKHTKKLEFHLHVDGTLLPAETSLSEGEGDVNQSEYGSENGDSDDENDGGDDNLSRNKVPANAQKMSVNKDKGKQMGKRKGDATGLPGSSKPESSKQGGSDTDRSGAWVTGRVPYFQYDSDSSIGSDPIVPRPGDDFDSALESDGSDIERPADRPKRSFPNIDLLKEAVAAHAVKTMHNIKVKKNNASWLCYHCKDSDDCPWRLHAKVINKGYEIRVYDWNHTCQPSSHLQACTSTLLAKMFICDMTLNNGCESFNSMILAARDKPIITMLEWMREYMMSRLQKNRDKARNKWKSRLCPEVNLILQEHTLALKKVTVRKSNAMYNVDFENMSCTCRRWQLTGIPCLHAVSALSHAKEDPYLYVNNCYTVDTYKSVYESAIFGINGADLWGETLYIPPLPPNFGKDQKPGKKDKVRRKGDEEKVSKTKKGKGGRKEENPYTLPMPKGSAHCGTCGAVGHNKRRCPINRPGLRKKRRNLSDEDDEENEQSVEVEQPAGNAKDEQLAENPQSQDGESEDDSSDDMMDMFGGLLHDPLSQVTFDTDIGSSNAMKKRKFKPKPMKKSEVPKKAKVTKTKTVKGISINEPSSTSVLDIIAPKSMLMVSPSQRVGKSMFTCLILKKQ